MTGPQADLIQPNAAYNAGLSNDAFRLALRRFVAEHFPSDLCEGFHRPMARIRGEAGRRWFRTSFDHGWRAPHWPREYGGMGLTMEKQILFHEEMDHCGVPRAQDFGGNLIGPTLIKAGTDTQRERFLKPMLTGEEIWAQGYSEPNAGSDLASLRTRAVRDGDHFVINGSKIWTTQATDADWIFMLVRTTISEKRQFGITFIVADMKTPGISLRPIRNILGEVEFYQTFLDDVRVPVENVVGEIDQGWSIAKGLLGIERLAFSHPIPARRALDMAMAIARQLGVHDRPEVKARFAVIAADIHDSMCLYDEVCRQLIAGANPAGDLSLLKVFCTELHQRAADLVVEMAGDYAALTGPSRIGDLDVDVGRLYSWVRAPTIFGGASEVQRNIVAREIMSPAGLAPNV
jgi:alkylation response protein AidB-like acyl-CoA dehydrogenase